LKSKAKEDPRKQEGRNTGLNCVLILQKDGESTRNSIREDDSSKKISSIFK
jgi:hypothetical protein